MPDDLIVAPASPPGRGALAIVRASGSGVLALAHRLCRTSLEPRHATRVRLELGDGVSEDAIVTAYHGPASYTGEDLVEFSVHGSPVIVDALLRACLERGARIARPGEFTYRAYLNGKLDLLQAEAVADLVAATTDAQVRVASAHLEGELSERIRKLGDGIAELRALLEASLDFPDEGFHFIESDTLVTRLGALRAACAGLLGSADAGRRLHDGALVVIAGRPNAGKSSLFNSLLARQRAIVTPVAGTTRDLLAEATSFGGVPVTLVDTAGLRSTSDPIEREGVARAEQSLEAADVVILVVDPSADVEDLQASAELWQTLGDRSGVCVLSKADEWRPQGASAPAWVPADAVAVSVVSGEGIGVLHERLAATLGRNTWDGATLTRARHRSLLMRCDEAIARAIETVSAGGSEEFVLVDVHDALVALDQLRGVETPEDVLTSIFSTFCIGK